MFGCVHSLHWFVKLAPILVTRNFQLVSKRATLFYCVDPNISDKGIKCYECEGYGYIASDRGKKKSKKKAFNLTWDDDTC